jgi:hypothetical protein
MIRLSVFVVWGAVIGCASAPGATVRQPAPSMTPSPVVNVYAGIPSEIGAFKLTERTAVRGLATDSIFRYRDGSRTILSVIIYNVPDGVRVDADSQKWTAREGDKFKRVQDLYVSRGQLAAYTVAFSDTTRFPAAGHNILEHSIATPVRFPNGAIAVELQYLYLIGGKFIKVRATIPQAGWEQTNVPSFARETAQSIVRGAPRPQ